jgi:hypothetical protein
MTDTLLYAHHTNHALNETRPPQRRPSAFQKDPKERNTPVQDPSPKHPGTQRGRRTSESEKEPL